jgi:hypothetical protein
MFKAIKVYQGFGMLFITSKLLKKCTVYSNFFLHISNLALSFDLFGINCMTNSLTGTYKTLCYKISYQKVEQEGKKCKPVTSKTKRGPFFKSMHIAIAFFL